MKSDGQFELRMELPDTVEASNGRGGPGLELSTGADGTLEAVMPERGVRLEIVASQGDVVARPQGLGPVGSSLASVTLVSLPSLDVQDLGAETAGERVEVELSGGVAA